MRRRMLLLVLIAFAILTSLQMVAQAQRTKEAAPVALAGYVSSKEENMMEGVLVSARRDGATFTVTVASGQNGRYQFPANRLESGKYAIRIRAIGYELDGPGSAEVIAGKTTVLDLHLRKTDNLASQLNNAEWALSVPGSPEQKQGLIGCVHCHDVDRILGSHHTADEFIAVMQRMATYYEGSTPSYPHKLYGGRPTGNPGNISPERLRSRAEYLASINLSTVSKWPYPLKTLPRPKGESTHVIITRYDLARPDILPHDVMAGQDGTIWYANEGAGLLGKFDTKTLRTVEYKIPEMKKGYPRGTLDMEKDKDGNIWLAQMQEGGVARFDRETEQFQTWALPYNVLVPDLGGAMIGHVAPTRDGKVWFNNTLIRAVHRLDVATGQIETFQVYRNLPPEKVQQHYVYGVTTDSKGNAYFMDMSGGNVGEIDAETGKVTLIPTPTPNAGPRRGHADAQDRVWFGENRVNKLGMLDTKTQKIQEWTAPTAYTNPYDAIADKNGEVWTGGEYNDRIVRLNPKTGKMIEYLLPDQFTNVRRVDVDNSTTPVTLWVGSTNSAAIIKVEPVD